MLHIEVTDPSPEPPPAPTLSDLSRNASVISSSSSSSSTSSLVLNTPRPRPVRTFSSPRSLSRDAPPTPRSTRPPAYLAKELGLIDDNDSYADLKKRAQSRSKSRARTKSRNSSAGFKLDVNDFEFGEILGEGSYSTVVHAIYSPTEQEYAIKILDKGHLKRVNKTQTAIAEKNTLVRLGSGHPGIVRLHWAFHDEWSLYFVLDLAKNGELQSRISRLGSLSLPCARYYAAQLVDAVAYMHSKGVIHRDLKPENLLLDDHMRLKITDFGTGKLLDDGSERAGTFVGTAQYVSPELLTTNNTSKASDIWAVGCIIFQMIAGRFPFSALSEYLMWQKVKSLDYTFPDGFDEVAKDVVQKLLVIDPTQRLGAGEPGTPYDIDALRRHPFFKDVNWDTLWSGPAPAMEAGLVKKKHPLSEQSYDVGVAWEQLVGNIGDVDEANLPWVEDDSEFSSENGTVNGYPFAGGGGEIGPLDIVPPPTNPGQNSAPVDQAEQRGRIGLPGSQQVSQPICIPPRDVARSSIVSSGSGTSSSEGSPVGRLNASMGAISLSPEQDRGRDRATTPIQLTTTPDAHWDILLHEGEKLVFHGPIELKSRTRRLTATLLPIPVTQNRPKMRHLLLTTQRLLCVKVKHGRKVSVKLEALLRSPSAGREGREERREKDTRPVITSVIAKGQRAFVVLTTGKPQQYAAESPVVQRWIEEISKFIKPESANQASSPVNSPRPAPPIPNGQPSRH
ncbi:kinase-like protein [Fomitiporia mediterranea MF3/22]|uniref:kinase-like protein n=1 Tax=Fomitiporia mediterranea (strain MF3/22) TaxID=694068 RepID=UPI000440870B|nr:kinase-like protein [Fomitiporia mediterranea MF3/22]EJD03171.1 kinase-like protein [Fomitiporia mediterranea MF3/22]